MDSFYVLWGLIGLTIIAWLINTLLLAKEGDEATFDDIVLYLMLIVLLVLIAWIDFLFCKVISYYADVTNHISRLEAKVDRMAAKLEKDNQKEGK